MPVSVCLRLVIVFHLRRLPLAVLNCSERSLRFLMKVLEAYELDGAASSPAAADVAARTVAAAVNHPTIAISSALARLASVGCQSSDAHACFRMVQPWLLLQLYACVI